MKNYTLICHSDISAAPASPFPSAREVDWEHSSQSSDQSLAVRTLVLHLGTIQDTLSSRTLPETSLLPGKAEMRHTLWLHLHAVPRLHGCLIVAILDDGRMPKVLVEMIHVLQNRFLAGHNNVIDRAKMLRVFREPNTARVWDHGYFEPWSLLDASTQERGYVQANFFAISRTARTSLTPPSLQASIWQTSTAPEASSCLKITRFWHISPVATPIFRGLRASRIALWPRMSSGEVGSSMNQGLNGARCAM